jgi:Fic family protein
MKLFRLQQRKNIATITYNIPQAKLTPAVVAAIRFASFSKGPTNLEDVYKGNENDRKILMQYVYGGDGNEVCNKWEKYYNPFDVTEEVKWERNNVIALNSINETLEKNQFDYKKFPESLKTAIAHQSVLLEGNRLSAGTTESIVCVLKSNPSANVNIVMNSMNRENWPKNSIHRDDVRDFINAYNTQEYVLKHLLTRHFTIRDILAVHDLVCKEDFASYPNQNDLGKFRVTPSSSRGCFTTLYAPAADIPKLMEKLMNMLNSDQLSPFVLYAKFYAEFLHIHPFKDGNGRIARLLHMILMIRKGYQPIFFEKIERDEYINALYLSTSLKKPNSWIRFLQHSIYAASQNGSEYKRLIK